MHFQYLLEKGNRRVEASQGVEADRLQVNGELYLGFTMPADIKSRVVVRGASEFSHLQCGLDNIGLIAVTRGALPLMGKGASVKLSYVAGDDHCMTETPVGAQAMPLSAPTMFDLADPFQVADLVIECDCPARPVFIGSSRRVSREPLYRLARGVGVEIGPGPKPQIHNRDGLEVLYIEEKRADEWLETYRTGAAGDAWERSNYRVGKAHDLPVDDGSLDFIFSSHVIEHLYNPLGHFDHWRKKLKSGGVVLGVVPAVEGTKDFVLPPTSIVELIEEHGSGSFETPLSAYQRWVRHHQPHHVDPDAVALSYMKDRFSIHVHVYDFLSINDLLRRCVSAHGYSNYRIQYKMNAKDFIFALKAD